MKHLKFFLILLVVLVLFGLRYAWYRSDKGDSMLALYVSKNVLLEGVVVDEPDVKETYTRLVVALDKVGREKISKTKILVYDDPYSKIAYGNRIKVEGKLEKPLNRSSDNGRTFDYVSYLAKDKIFYQVQKAKIEIIKKNQGNFLKSLALSVKRNFVTSLDKSLPYLESKLGAGLTIAGKQALPKNVQDEFVKTGTVQVVVLSGYNVTIIADAVRAALGFLPAAIGIAAGAFIIFLFAIAAGGSATIIRAVIMASIALLGKVSRRPYQAGRALLVAAIIMLALNPMLLFFDASFQLSFIATFGLIYFTPVIKKRFSFLNGENKVKEIIASTAATQIFVTPFILYLTGNLSLVALPANLFLSLLVPVTMLASFVTGTLGLFFGFLGQIFAFPAFVLLKIMLLIVHFFSSVPGASFIIPYFPLWAVLLSYGFYTFIFLKFSSITDQFKFWKKDSM